MSLTHGAAARAAIAEAVAAFVDLGSGTANLRILDAGDVVLIEFPLADPAYSSNGAGVITLLETPMIATAQADGIATKFEARNRDGDLAYTGTAVQQGQAGDLALMTTELREGYDYALHSHTYTAPV
ncbi:MAG: hypothetical protein ACRECF_00750 [Methyloceanibacter sp.]